MVDLRWRILVPDASLIINNAIVTSLISLKIIYVLANFFLSDLSTFRFEK